MLATTVAAVGKRSVVAAKVIGVQATRSMGAWVRDDPAVSQSLIAELTANQAASAESIVPWFLKNMPESYYVQVAEDIRRTHMKAAGAFKDFSSSSDMSLKLETKSADGTITWTNFSSSNDKALMANVLKKLVVPDKMRLSAVGIYQSLDHTLTLQMFTFVPDGNTLEHASPSDAAHILNVAAEICAGEHVGDSRFPRDTGLFSEEELRKYIKFCTPAYCNLGTPRRFLIQRRMYERVRSTDKVAVHVEKADGDSRHGAAHSQWITIAAANVLPDVLYRITAKMLLSHNFTVEQSHMDRVEDPANSTAELPGFVTMLRVNGNFTEENTSMHMQDVIAALKRAKW